MTSARKTRVLVTGASSGIGRAIAETLVARGAIVYGTSRSPGTGASSGVEMLALDVRSDDSVKSCVDTFVARAGGVDVLVNNAGYALTGGAEETSIEEAKEQFDTNFFGVARMTRAVLPFMRQAGGGRIITMGSLVGRLGIPFASFYSATKFALEGYCEALWYEVRPYGIFVSIIEPNWVRTGLGESAPIASAQMPAYSARERASRASIQRYIEEGLEPARVVERVLRALDDPSPTLRYPVGGQATWLPRVKEFLPWSSFAATLGKRFGQ